MSRSKTPVQSPAGPPTTAAEPSAISLREHPIVSALLMLASAVSAVAKFPNQPVPASLTGRLDQAQLALGNAIDQVDEVLGLAPFSLAAGVDDTGYDDAWIKERFESLDVALRERFIASDADAAKARSELAKSLDDRFAAIERAISAAKPTAASATETD